MTSHEQMMELRKIDREVAEALGIHLFNRPLFDLGGIKTGDRLTIPYFTTDWNQGGPIIDKYEINIQHREGPSSKLPVRAWMKNGVGSGPTALIAAMRALVDHHERQNK